MNWHVNVVWPKVPATDQDLGRFGGLAGTPITSILFNSSTGTTQARVQVSAASGSMAYAVDAALEAVRSITEMLGVQPDAAGVLSDRAHLQELGGPDELERMQRWLAGDPAPTAKE